MLWKPASAGAEMTVLVFGAGGILFQGQGCNNSMSEIPQPKAYYTIILHMLNFLNGGSIQAPLAT